MKSSVRFLLFGIGVLVGLIVYVSPPVTAGPKPIFIPRGGHIENVLIKDTLAFIVSGNDTLFLHNFLAGSFLRLGGGRELYFGVDHISIGGEAYDFLDGAGLEVSSADSLQAAIGTGLAFSGDDIIVSALDSSHISAGGVSFSDIGQNSANTGEVIVWTGSAWDAQSPSSGGWTDVGTYLIPTSTSDSVKIGTAGTPTKRLQVTGSGIQTTNLRASEAVVLGGDSVRLFTGNGLEMSGTNLTATLGTDIVSSEIFDGTIVEADVTDADFLSEAEGLSLYMLTLELDDVAQVDSVKFIDFRTGWFNMSVSSFEGNVYFDSTRLYAEYDSLSTVYTAEIADTADNRWTVSDTAIQHIRVDTLIKFVEDQDTVWVQSENPWLVFGGAGEVVLVDGRFGWVTPGGTEDTIWFPRTKPSTDGYILEWDAAGDSMAWGVDNTGAGGGSGDTLVIRASSTDYTIVDNALRLYPRYGLTATAGDSGGVVDTISLSVDTASLNADQFATDVDVAKIGDDTTNYQTAYDISNALDTFIRLGPDRNYFDTLLDSVIVILSDSALGLDPDGLGGDAVDDNLIDTGIILDWANVWHRSGNVGGATDAFEMDENDINDVRVLRVGIITGYAAKSIDSVVVNTWLLLDTNENGTGEQTHGIRWNDVKIQDPTGYGLTTYPTNALGVDTTEIPTLDALNDSITSTRGDYVELDGDTMSGRLGIEFTVTSGVDTGLYVNIDSGATDGDNYGYTFGGTGFNNTDDAGFHHHFGNDAGSYYGIYLQVEDTNSSNGWVQPILVTANDTIYDGTLFKINAEGGGKGLHISKTADGADGGNLLVVEDYNSVTGSVFRQYAGGNAVLIRLSDSTAGAVGLQLLGHGAADTSLKVTKGMTHFWGQTVTGLPDPSNDSDAVSLGYANSTYETITNVAKIGDDTTTWNAVAAAFDTSYDALTVVSLTVGNDAVTDFDSPTIEDSGGVLIVVDGSIDATKLSETYLTTETDPVWVSDSSDYAFKTWVQTEIEDSLNEYLLINSDSPDIEDSGGVLIFTRDRTLTGDPTLEANHVGFATTGLIFEGDAANTAEGLVRAQTITVDRTWDLADASGYLLLSPSSNGIVVRTSAGVSINRSIAVSSTLDMSVANGSGASGNPTLAFVKSSTLAGNPAVAAGKAIFADSGFIFEGKTADGSEGMLQAIDVTADRRWYLPDATGTIALTSDLSAYLPLAGGEMSGNITMAGTETVDGVDISALDADLAADSGSWNAAADAFDTNYVFLTTDTGLFDHMIVFGDTTGTGYRLPIADGTADQVMVTNGSGILSFADAGGAGLWVASNDTIFLPDADGDTIAAFYDDDAGNVQWRVGVEDQTLHVFADSLTIGTDLIGEYIADAVGAMVTGNTETQIVVTYDDADNTLDFDASATGDLQVYGDISYWGQLLQVDRTHDIRINDPFGSHADTVLTIHSYAWIDTSGSGDTVMYENIADSNFYNCVVHPDLKWVPQGWNGYKWLLVHTPLPNFGADQDSAEFELPTLTVSNDPWGESMVFHAFIDSFSASPTFDSLSGPIVPDPSYYVRGGGTGSYLSDPDLIIDENGILWCVYRVTFGAPYAGHQVVAAAWTTDGLNWNLTNGAGDTLYLIDTLVSNGVNILSPSWSKDGDYYYLHCVFNSVPPDTSNVWTYRSEYAGSTYTHIHNAVETPLAGNFDGTKLWHLNTLERGPDELLFMGAFIDSGQGGEIADGFLRLGVSHDNGQTIVWDSTTALGDNPSDNAWDERWLYRFTGVWADAGQYEKLKIIYSARSDNHKWACGLTEFYLDDTIPPQITDTADILRAEMGDTLEVIDSSRISPKVISETDINFGRPRYHRMEQVYAQLGGTGADSLYGSNNVSIVDSGLVFVAWSATNIDEGGDVSAYAAFSYAFDDSVVVDSVIVLFREVGNIILDTTTLYKEDLATSATPVNTLASFAIGIGQGATSYTRHVWNNTDMTLAPGQTFRVHLAFLWDDSEGDIDNDSLFVRNVWVHYNRIY